MDVIQGSLGFDSRVGHGVYPTEGPFLPLDRMLGRAMIGDGTNVKITIVDHLVVIEKTGVDVPFSAEIAALLGASLS